MLLDQVGSLDVTKRMSVSDLQRCRTTYLHRLCNYARRRELRDMRSITLRSLMLLLMMTNYLHSLNPQRMPADLMHQATSTTKIQV
jgi:hypothetical protein